MIFFVKTAMIVTCIVHYNRIYVDNKRERGRDNMVSKKMVYISLFIILLLQGCAKKDYNHLVDNSNNLTVLNMMSRNSPTYAVEESIWTTFASENPHIIVTRHDMDSPAAYFAELSRQLSSGQLDDVVYFYSSGNVKSWTQVYAANAVKDLSHFIYPQIQFFRTGLLVGDYDNSNKLGMIPISSATSHFIYGNQSLMQAYGINMPQNYEDLLAIKKKLEGTGIDIYSIGAASTNHIEYVLFGAILGRMAGIHFINNVLTGKTDFHDNNFTSALAAYQKLFTDEIISDDIFTYDSNQATMRFLEGKSLFLIDAAAKSNVFIGKDTSYDWPKLTQAQQDNISLSVLPELPNSKIEKSTTSNKTQGFGMSAKIPDNTKKESYAWKLIEYLSSKEVQTIRLKADIALPSRNDVIDLDIAPNNMVRRRIEFSNSLPNATKIFQRQFPDSVVKILNENLALLALNGVTPEIASAKINSEYKKSQITGQ